jgi:hypothetical protein
MPVVFIIAPGRLTDGMILECLIASVLCSMLCGFAGHARGRNFAGWFFLSLFLIGPIALLFVLVLRPLTKNVDLQRLADHELRRCPTCAELVRYEALKCRFCLADLPEEGVSFRVDDVSPEALRARREKRSTGFSWS